MPETASRPMSPPGKNDRLDHVRVGGDHQPAVADRHRRAVVHRGEADARRSATVAKSREEHLLDQPAHRAAAGAVLQRDALVDAADVHTSASELRDGPPYSCQMRQVPSLLTMHAPTGVSGTHSRPNSGQSRGDCDARP